MVCVTFDKCAYFASACVCAEPSHTGNLSRGRALIDKKKQQKGPHCVRRLLVQRCNHYLQLTTISLLLHPSLRPKPRPSPLINSCKSHRRIYYSRYASIYSSVTHLSPSFTSSLLCFYPPVHSIIVSIYLFYSPSAPRSFHPSIPSHSMRSDSSVIRWQWRQ